MIKFNALFLGEDVFVKVVEHLQTQHNEARVMSASEADVIQVVEPYTELRADKRIGRWINLACNIIWLETVDAGSNVVNLDV